MQFRITSYVGSSSLVSIFHEEEREREEGREWREGGKEGNLFISSGIWLNAEQKTSPDKSLTRSEQLFGVIFGLILEPAAELSASHFSWDFFSSHHLAKGIIFHLTSLYMNT